MKMVGGITGTRALSPLLHVCVGFCVVRYIALEFALNELSLGFILFFLSFFLFPLLFDIRVSTRVQQLMNPGDNPHIVPLTSP